MRCDNHCLRCEENNKIINHAIFECPLTIQTWYLAENASSPLIFHSLSQYTNINYPFWRKNDIKDPNMDKNPYLRIIWYIFEKQKNDKLFRGINRDPLKTIRHA